MRVSLNWLKEYVDIDISTERLAEILINAGIEVEGIHRLGEGLDSVVVARILSMRPHPNADRLTLCSVTTGEKIHSIVCGARNMKEGDYVALALPGAHLPNGMKISKSKIRGEVSEGMLCSEAELGLARESAGIMILTRFADELEDAIRSAQLGQPLARFLMLEDTVLDVSITPNRPDCLSVIGIAREVSALTGKGLKRPGVKFAEGGFDTSSVVKVEVLDLDSCPRYTARVIKGVSTGPSPLWMQRRIEASGMRPINNVVDITNYVMLETGQPLHAFDLSLLSGSKIIVRRADGSENITTLDGVERALDKDTLIIADGGKPLAIAGVMGGMGSEVSGSTTDILLESAYFKPTTVRKASRRFGLHTESSHRFERGVDPNGVLDASGRAAQLILQVAGGEAASPADIYPVVIKPLDIELRMGRVNTILGVDMDTASVADCLGRLGLSARELDKERVVATPPTFRVDLTREIDLIEEVARVVGYERIPLTHPKVELRAGEKDRKEAIKDRIRGFLTGQGFHEAATYTFLPPKMLSHFLPSGVEPVRLLNPLSEEQSVMRTTIIPSLLDVVNRNLSHRNEDLRFFEIGRIFPYQGDKGEKVMVSGLMTGLRYPVSWNLPAGELDFFDLKGVVENLLDSLNIPATFLPAETSLFLHPGKAAVVDLGGMEAGILGEVHPDVMRRLDIKGRAYVFEMDMESIIESVREASFTHIPRFPAVYRDIAVVVDKDAPSERVCKVIKGMDPLVEKVTIFDVYQGEPIPDGKKSMAYSVRYQATDRTLGEDEVNTVHDRIVAAIKEELGGVLRE